MTPEYFIDHLPGLLSAAASLIAAVTGLMVVFRQSVNTARIDKIEKTTAATHYDINNGIGEKIADKAVEKITPVLEKAATVAAEKVAADATVAREDLKENLREVAKDTAVALATGKWDGVDLRPGK